MAGASAVHIQIWVDPLFLTGAGLLLTDDIISPTPLCPLHFADHCAFCERFKTYSVNRCGSLSLATHRVCKWTKIIQNYWRYPIVGFILHDSDRNMWPRTGNVTKEWSKLHSRKLSNLYSSDYIRVMKSYHAKRETKGAVKHLLIWKFHKKSLDRPELHVEG
jgi:hypothetical protein